MYRFILFYFVLYICIYVAPWSCETRHLVPLYVHTCSGMTIKLNLTWLDLTIRNLEFLQRRFWWPTIKEDTKSFVTACPTCNQGKVSHRSPQDLLHPRSITRRPWSHLSVDFITGLPPSYGNTTIMVIVDRFSKAGRFIPLPKLPTAKVTAELINNYVFRVYGIPQDIVSDQGPQFSSRFWQRSVNFWGWRWAYTLDSILSPMVKQRD